jgi:3-dehydroquinate dehydratase-2
MTPVAVLVLDGPNLNLLGLREPAIYGTTSLAALQQGLRLHGEAVGASLRFVQSNHEGALIDTLHGAMHDGTEIVLLNAGGLTHTSVALRDAIAGTAMPVIEVHLSNTAAREPFRRRSLVAGVAVGTVAGFGPLSYRLALDAAVDHIRGRRAARRREQAEHGYRDDP